MVISINSLNSSKVMLTETWFSGFFPNRGTIRPLALVSPGPLSATKRKSVLLPQTSCAVRDRLFPSARARLYLADHEGDILLHKAAKNAFDELGVKKLPTVKSLQEEYAKLLAEKKAAYAEYRRSRDEMRELLLHKQNVDRMLGKDERSEEKKQEHDRQ